MLSYKEIFGIPLWLIILNIVIWLVTTHETGKRLCKLKIARVYFDDWKPQRYYVWNSTCLKDEKEITDNSQESILSKWLSRTSKVKNKKDIWRYIKNMKILYINGQ